MGAEKQPVFNAAGTHVFVKNSETGGEWECPPDYLPVALVRGWEYADAPDEDLSDLFDEAPKPVAKKAASSKPGD